MAPNFEYKWLLSVLNTTCGTCILPNFPRILPGAPPRKCSLQGSLCLAGSVSGCFHQCCQVAHNNFVLQQEYSPVGGAYHCAGLRFTNDFHRRRLHLCNVQVASSINHTVIESPQIYTKHKLLHCRFRAPRGAFWPPVR